MHASARLIALAVLGTALAALPARAQDAGDADAGQKIFRTQCGICHSPLQGKNMVGPSLFGVIGRHTGTVAGFHYSNANKNADIVWGPEILEKYLAAPREVVPGTIMTFAGLKDARQRADVIAYLATLK